ncbi:MAG: PEP-CTERM-box response regulator transcription factor [Thermodesulfobacteriota bacterium]
MEMKTFNSKQKLLIVEDDAAIATQMKWALAQDYDVLLAEDREKAVGIIKKEKPRVVTLDLGLPPYPSEVSEGFLTLGEILGEDNLIKIIVITGQGQKEHALKAIGYGAYDFFTKPIQIEELKIVIKRAFYVAELERENQELQGQLAGDSFQGMIGMSPKMQQVFSAIRKVAATDAPILITGESGTGKELVAKAIHLSSSRKEKPFIVINSSAIPETLLESELFGHEKGAFTGAHIRRKGRIELAEGGTLFLDEIGDLSLTLQVKLLRFLQEHKIERVGGREEIKVDTRILAATNVDLKKAIKEGRFREDLYYRLGVVTISLPPLRERGEDIFLIANYLLRKYAAENKKKIIGFTPHALEAMEAYVWPGNIRELENRVKRAVIMAEGTRITANDLELSSRFPKYETLTLKEAREALERDFINRALMKNRGNVSKAAEDLGISRPSLYELMEKLGIQKE